MKAISVQYYGSCISRLARRLSESTGLGSYRRGLLHLIKIHQRRGHIAGSGIVRTLSAADEFPRVNHGFWRVRLLEIGILCVNACRRPFDLRTSSVQASYKTWW